MSDWLGVWDVALEEAVRDGEPGQLWKFDRDSALFVLVAQTRHPAFMAAIPPKYDQRRDMPTSAQTELASENPEPHQVDTERDNA